MGALNGRMSPLTFHTTGKVEDWDKIVDSITRYRFQDLDPASGIEQKFGWVLMSDPFSYEFEKTRIFYGEDLVGLTFRIDSISVPASQLKLHLNKRINELTEEAGGQKPSKRDIEALKEDMHSAWVKRMVPTIKLFEMVYNTTTGKVWFFGKSKGAVESFLDPFHDTF